MIMATRLALLALLVRVSCAQQLGNFSAAALPPILQFLNGTPVTSPSQWSARRAEIASLLQDVFYGTFPTAPAPAITSTATLNSTTARGYESTWVNITYATPVNASFLLAEVIRPLFCTAAQPCPVMFTVREHRRWGITASHRGYVACIYAGGDNSCDSSECGVVDPTRNFAQNYPNASFQLIARRAYIASRTLDYVITLPFVRGGQVAITGHSRNGKQSLIAAGFDDRFTAVVDSSSGAAGISAYRFSSNDAWCETPGTSWPGPWFLPSLRGYEGSEDALPIDAHAIAGLIAPRHLLLAHATADSVIPTFSVEMSYAEARAVYAFTNASERVRVDYRPGEHHGFEAIDRYLDWFDYAFNYSHPIASARTGATYDASHWPETSNLYHAFNWTAWAALQPSPPPLPPPNATIIDRIAWGLGDAPAPGPVSSPGGVYDFMSYIDLLMLHDQYIGDTNVTRINVNIGAYVWANLYFATSMLAATPPPGGWPAVVWLHPLSYNKGYVPSYTINDTMDVVHGLANASFVVLAFDALGLGMRVPEGAQFYDRFPRWSKLGRMVHDVMSAVDLLSAPQNGFLPAGPADRIPTFPVVNPGKIYACGYSVGAAAALHAAALDARIAGVVSIMGFTPMRLDTDASRSGGIRRWWQWHATQPRLGWFAGSEAALPYDYDAVLTAIAPRPVFVYQPTGDRQNSATDVSNMVQQLCSEGYTNITLSMPAGVNAMTASVRLAATQVLQAWAGA